MELIVQRHAMRAKLPKVFLVVGLVLGFAVADGARGEESDIAPGSLALGIGVAGLNFPAYRGSDQRSTWLLPVPYLEYNGDFFKADRQGLRGQIFDSPRVQLSVSASGSPPVSSDGIARRRGMPELKASLEVGPQLSVLLSDPQDSKLSLRLRLPLRQGITLERRPQDIGLTFSPNLNLDLADPWGLPRSNLGFLVGPIFTSRTQNNYFYGVAAPFASVARPAYQAGGGYAGAQALVSLSRKFGDWWVGGFVRYDNLQGAVFEGSSLVASRSYLTAGVALSYIFVRF
ncbi:MAG: MipA/OmpV family protein [Polaromonas sp.]|nr:MipA/OmpV family protein [Polaromonas sp.]